MKKLFSLALTAALAGTMLASAFAADNEYAYKNDFEDEPIGDYVNTDNVIIPAAKSGTIDIAEFDGSHVLKYAHPANDSGYDCFTDLFLKGNSVFTLEGSYVVEYDVYFETVAEDMTAYLIMSRETPAAGTQFIEAGKFYGEEMKIKLTGDEGYCAPFTTGKWYTVSVCFDVDNNLWSVWLDGVCLAKDNPYPETADASATFTERARIGFSNHTGESVMYIDNLRAYSGTVPYGVTNVTPTTIQVSAPTTGASTSTGSAAATADIAVILAAVSAVAASGIIVSKKRK